MLQNAYFLAKIGADTAENEQHFAEILPKIGNYPTGCGDLRSRQFIIDRTEAIRKIYTAGPMLAARMVLVGFRVAGHAI